MNVRSNIKCLKYILTFALGFCAFQIESLAQSQTPPEIHCKHIIYGIPIGTPKTNDLIIRDVYALNSNDSTKFADWVAYRLDKDIVEGSANTKRNWRADPWLDEEETLEPADYKEANATLKTDRGHQAPLASFKGTEHWHQTNYLSNITPQKENLNQGPWKDIEEKVRAFVKAGNIVHVYTGPLYKSEMPNCPKQMRNTKFQVDTGK